MSEKEPMDFKDAMPKLDSVGKLTDLEDEAIYIISYDVLPPMGSLGEGAIATIEREDGTIEKRHTFSKVLVKQLKAIDKNLKQKKVLATVTKIKTYYVFK